MANQAERESLYAAACQQLAGAVGYLARLAPVGAPLPAPALQARQLPQLGPLPRPRSRRHGRRPRLQIREDGEDDDGGDDDDGDDDEEEREDAIVDTIRRVIVHDSDADDDIDDFAFGVQDLYYAAMPILAAVPPYPLSRGLSDEFLQSSSWTLLLFANGIIFTAAVTYYSVVVFRSTRRCFPTFLRALLLAVTLGAEVAAAAHLPPSSHLAMILSYASILLHIFVYLLTWAAFCIWMTRRRQLHPVP